MFKHLILALMAGLLFAVPSLSSAQEPQNQETQSATIAYTDDPEPAQAAPDIQDREVQARINDIFDAISDLQDIDVDVSGGVVTLTGMVQENAVITRAEELATKVEGVVAVQNAIELDRSVTGRLGPAGERARTFANDAIGILPLLAVAVVILVIFWALGALIGRQEWLWRRVAGNPLVAGLLRTIIPVIFIILGLIIALNILDAVAVLSAVLGAAGVLGLAIGFAIRDTIENFIASIMLSLRQPFRPNDVVDIDGKVGNVARLTSRATILMTPDGNHLRIPNSQVFKAVITNFTRVPERRITFALGVDANDNPQDAIATGLAAMKPLPFILDEPEPVAWIDEVGDSNIVLVFAPWIDQTESDHLKAKSAAIVAVKDALEEQGFTLPEPIYRLRIDQMPNGLLMQTTPSDGPSDPSGASGSSTPTPPQSPPAAKKPKPASAAPMDVSRDDSIERKVAEDRVKSGEKDLLDGDAPTEFGDEGKDQPGS